MTQMSLCAHNHTWISQCSPSMPKPWFLGSFSRNLSILWHMLWEAFTCLLSYFMSTWLKDTWQLVFMSPGLLTSAICCSAVDKWCSLACRGHRAANSTKEGKRAWMEQSEVKWRTPGKAPTRDVIKLRQTVLQPSGQGNQAQTPTPFPTHTRKVWLRLWKGVRLICQAVIHLEPPPASALLCHSFIKVSSCRLSFWLHLCVCVLFSYITVNSTWWNNGLPFLLFIWLNQFY